MITGAVPVSMHSIVWRIPSVQGQRDPSSKICQQPALFCHISYPARSPVLADHLDRALGAVELDPRHLVALHREPGGDHGVAGIAEVEQQVRVVVRPTWISSPSTTRSGMAMPLMAITRCAGPSRPVRVVTL